MKPRSPATRCARGSAPGSRKNPGPVGFARRKCRSACGKRNGSPHDHQKYLVGGLFGGTILLPFHLRDMMLDQINKPSLGPPARKKKKNEMGYVRKRSWRGVRILFTCPYASTAARAGQATPGPRDTAHTWPQGIHPAAAGIAAEAAAAPTPSNIRVGGRSARLVAAPGSR